MVGGPGWLRGSYRSDLPSPRSWWVDWLGLGQVPLIGHLEGGMSRSDIKEVWEM